MRNCFVPCCDYQSSAKKKRMMFLPPKDNELFEKWKEILPKKRPFKKTDKICERHFNPSDINTTFDHVINGELFQMARGKPKLKPNVIPSKNLPELEEIEEFRRGRKNGKYINKNNLRNKKISEIMTSPNKSKIKLKNPSKKKVAEMIEYLEDDDDIIKPIQKENYKLNVCKIEKNTNNIEILDESQNNCEKLIENTNSIQHTNNFEIIYDDIFEVVLPNTLWGVHRDPTKKFIAFSYYDPKSRATNKIVELTNKLILKVIVHNKVVTEKMYSEIEHEVLTTILSETNSMRICSLHFSKNCLIKVKAIDRELCDNCLLLELS